jgi:hypothetical protein
VPELEITVASILLISKQVKITKLEGLFDNEHGRVKASLFGRDGGFFIAFIGRYTVWLLI